MDNIEPKITQSKDYNTYMKTYMNSYYKKNSEKLNLRRKTLNYIKKNDIPEDVANKYGDHLINVIKIKELLDMIPNDLIRELCSLYLPPTASGIANDILHDYDNSTS
jgi:hypothetical protein